jgi:hypothetical protein
LLIKKEANEEEHGLKVDWFPWGEEDDFTRAQAEDKHIFPLSGIIITLLPMSYPF